MIFVPLNQIESVQMVINSMLFTAGEIDNPCTVCPAAQCCTKQCSTIANGIQNMMDEGTLPEQPLMMVLAQQLMHEVLPEGGSLEQDCTEVIEVEKKVPDPVKHEPRKVIPFPVGGR